MASILSLRKRETIGWIDWLRVIAILLVIVSHCSDHFTALYGVDDGNFLLGAIIGSFVRPCVPLFAMMTGVLLLPIKSDITYSSFLSRRIGRLVWPLIFWSLALPVMNYLAFNYVWTDPKNLSLVGPFNIHNLVNHLYTWIFNFNYDTTPLWYVYMLIGIYFIMPIVGSWIVNASRKDVELVLRLWIITLFLPYIQYFAPALGYEGNYGSFGILGVCSWNAFGTFYYVAGFIGYIILAYYLAKYPLKWRGAGFTLLLIAMFIVGFTITTLGFISLRGAENWDLIEMCWSFCSINVFLMTFPIFVLMQRSGVKSSSRISNLAIMSFGVYLCHFSIVQFGYEIFYSTGLPGWLRLLLNVICSSVVSFAIVRCMISFKPLRRFVM